MNDGLQFSVIIPAFNASAYIESTLRSVTRQTYPFLEILVVDDCSTDNTVAIVKALAQNDPRIKLLSTPQASKGVPGRVRNCALKQAKGNWISFLDADDIWKDSKLQHVAFTIIQNPDAAVVHHDQLPFDANGEASKGILSSRTEYELGKLSGKCFKTAFEWNCFCTSSMSVRRDALEDVGYFQESRRFAPVEDYELWLRIVARYDTAFIPSNLALYRLHDSNISGNAIRSLHTLLRVLKRVECELPDAVASIPRAKIRRRYGRTYLLLAYWHSKQGNASAARRYYRKAIATDPTLTVKALRSSARWGVETARKSFARPTHDWIKHDAAHIDRAQ